MVRKIMDFALMCVMIASVIFGVFLMSKTLGALDSSHCSEGEWTVQGVCEGIKK